MPSSNRIAYSKHSCQNRNCNEPRSFVRCHLHHMIGSILFYAGPTCPLLPLVASFSSFSHINDPFTHLQ